MRLLLTKFDEQWVELTGLGGKLLMTVRYGIKQTYRKFDQNTQHWLVHWSQLTFLITIARGYGVDVDYSALPTTWQLKAAGARVAADAMLPALEEPPFAKLYVTDDAPVEVVHAAFRALAKKFHPDVGGTTERFQEIDLAYRRILALRGCE